MGGLRTVAGSVLIAAACLLVACEDDEPAAPAARPETVEEFFAELERAIQKDGKVFHATVELRAVDNGVEGLWATTEGWVQGDAGRARTHWRKGPDNRNDIAERTVHIYSPDGVYSANLDGDDDPSFRLPAEAESCFADAPTPIVAQVACGFLPFGGPDWELSVEQSRLEGRATVALVGTYAVSSPVGSEEFPVGGPTPHPVMTAATRAFYKLHLDATSYLPLASVSWVDSDPNLMVFGSEARFQTEFLDDSSLPQDWFDPGSIGYVAPAKQQERGAAQDRSAPRHATRPVHAGVQRTCARNAEGPPPAPAGGRRPFWLCGGSLSKTTGTRHPPRELAPRLRETWPCTAAHCRGLAAIPGASLARCLTAANPGTTLPQLVAPLRPRWRWPSRKP